MAHVLRASLTPNLPIQGSASDSRGHLPLLRNFTVQCGRSSTDLGSKLTRYRGMPVCFWM